MLYAALERFLTKKWLAEKLTIANYDRSLLTAWEGIKREFGDGAYLARSHVPFDETNGEVLEMSRYVASRWLSFCLLHHRTFYCRPVAAITNRRGHGKRGY